LFESAKIPTYDTPEKATRGLMHMVRYRKAQQLLLESPPSLPAEFRPDLEKARTIIDAALGAGGGWLDPIAAQEILSCYGIPTPRAARVTNADEAAKQAASFSSPVALKIDSPDIIHKSDAGGVELNLEGAAVVRAAAETMLTRVAKSAPHAHIRGFIVQEMIRRPGAYELILGLANDATFGSFLLFGHGGAAVEVIDDTALGLPPLNLKLARELMARTRIWRQLNGFRDQPPAALDAIAMALVGLSQLACDFDSIAELDINPLLADTDGIVAVDVRILLEPNAGSQNRLAIRPYPSEWESVETIAGLGDFRLRPVRPEDAPAFVVFAAKLAPEDVRMRFFTPFRTLPRALLARLTQIDYDRAMAFVLFDASNAVAGVARLAADPDGDRAEFAVIVRSDLKGRGVGSHLIDRLIVYARARGIEELFGDVLAENSAMLALCRDIGAKLKQGPAGIMRATINLRREDRSRSN
jgi:acetyltransferase